MERLKKLLQKHEGFRSKPYLCSAGKTTIGYGRNLDDNGISVSEAEILLQNDILDCIHEANNTFPWYKHLSPTRQGVVLSMIFNLGITRFFKFKKTIEHIKNKEYEKAGEEMLNSRWAKQVGIRAVELSYMMKVNSYLASIE
jgi:lysozyme